MRKDMTLKDKIQKINDGLEKLPEAEQVQFYIICQYYDENGELSELSLRIINRFLKTVTK